MSKPMKQIKGVVARYLIPNTDTDTISPAMFLKRTVRDNFERFAFLEKRYTPATQCIPSLESKDFVFIESELNKDCPLNHPNSKGATFLLTWSNFGCGSSRENAVWALKNYKVIIGSAPEGQAAFADIFRDNCRQNLIWTPVISAEDHETLNALIDKTLPEKPVELELHVAEQEIRVVGTDYLAFKFDIPISHVKYILEGKTPAEKAKEQIDFYLPAIREWYEVHEASKKFLTPSTAKSD